MDRPRFGYLRVLVMLKREGWAVGKKRGYRLYRLEDLQLRMKVKRLKRISVQRGRVVPVTGPNQHWSMDFVHDQMLNGRAFRILTVIDQWSRESASLEANSSSWVDALGRHSTRLQSCVGCPRRSRSTTARSSRPTGFGGDVRERSPCPEIRGQGHTCWRRSWRMIES